MGYSRFGDTMNKNWQEKARCLDMNTNYFFDMYEEDVDFRSGIDSLCKACPVQRECLAAAVSRQEWGVWGGVYFEKGKISKEFNNHKKEEEWFDIWKSLTMESK